MSFTDITMPLSRFRNLLNRLRFAVKLRSLDPFRMQQQFGKNVYIHRSPESRMMLGRNTTFKNDIKIGCRRGLIDFGEKLIMLSKTRVQCFGELHARNRIIIGRNNIISIKNNGCMILGNRLRTDRDVELVSDGGQLTIGVGCYIGHASSIVARQNVNIGNNTLIADMVTIRDHDHKYSATVPPMECGYTIGSIVIEENCWIGSKSTITAGVKIGRNSVVGANSVVTVDVNEKSVVAGSPARVIKRIIG